MSTHESYWQLLESEGRFNTIQATIRGVAATWLLGTVAAIGFVLRPDTKAAGWILAPGDLALGVLSASSLGLLLLWILDIRVYQRLLASTFLLRLYMEYRDATLPPSAAASMASTSGKGMTRILRYFYSVPVLLFVLSGAAAAAITSVAVPSAGAVTARLFAVAVAAAVWRVIEMNSASPSLDLAATMKDPGFDRLFAGGRADVGPILSAFANKTQGRDPPPFSAKSRPTDRDAVAPDGSDVRILLGLAGGGMACFELAAGETSIAVTHKTVEEVWYFLAGEGTMWRRQDGREEIIDVSPGLCLTLPLGTAFQFRASGSVPLEAVGVTMPPWPGDGEAVAVSGKWEPTVRR